jgi:hypothetical protein
MAADVAGTLGQRNDPGSWPFFSCLYSSSCQDGKFSNVHMQNRASGTGTPTDSATSNTQAQTSNHSISRTCLKMRSDQYAAPREHANKWEGYQELRPPV